MKKMMMDYFGCVLKIFTNTLKMSVFVKFKKIINYHQLNYKEILDFFRLILRCEGFIRLEFHNYVNVLLTKRLIMNILKLD